MPFFGERDEAENRFKEAERYSNPRKKEFDLDAAIRFLEEAVMLKPDKKQYCQKLEEIREIKSKSSLKFSMQARNRLAITFPDGKLGVRVSGIAEQGSIRDGDEVEIRGGKDTRRGKVFEVVSPKERGFGVAGQYLDIAIVGDVKDGDMIAGV